MKISKNIFTTNTLPSFKLIFSTQLYYTTTDEEFEAN